MRSKNITLISVLNRVICCLLAFCAILTLSACGNNDDETNNEQPNTLPYVLNEIELNLNVKESFQLNVLNLGEKDVVIWGSNNETIVNVVDGLVTGIKPGVATVIAKVGDKSLNCKVTVSIEMLSIPVFTIENLEFKDGYYFLNMIKGDSFEIQPQLKIDGDIVDGITYAISESSDLISVENLSVSADQVCDNVELTVTCEYDGVTYTLKCRVSVGEVA